MRFISIIAAATSAAAITGASIAGAQFATPAPPLTPCVLAAQLNPGANVISGGAAAEVLVGTPGVDIISGGGGADTILGLGGDDVICGDDGADVGNRDTTVELHGEETRDDRIYYHLSNQNPVEE